MSIVEFDTDALVSVAHEMADAARDAILPYFRTPDLSTENKDQTGYDPVTLADRAAELAMRDVLQTHRPNDAIIGEEFGNTAGSTGLVWVLDPIDGTRAFVAGTPTWGVLIAVGNATGPKIGVIDQPYIGERFTGTPDVAYMSGPLGQKTLATHAPRLLSDAIVFTTFPEVGTPADAAGFNAVAAEAKLVRYGMDCYAYALLAAGQIDLVIEAGLNSYDIQAPIALIHAAGGIVTDWAGGPAHNGGRAVAAANADIHAAALSILKGH